MNLEPATRSLRPLSAPLPPCPPASRPRDPAETPQPSPQFETPKAERVASPRRRVRHHISLALALTPLVLVIAVIALRGTGLVHADIELWVGLAGSVIGASALLYSGVNLVRSLLRLGHEPLRSALASAGLSILTGLAALLSSAVSSTMMIGSGRGRQLRRLGRPLHAELHDGSPWLGATATQPTDVALAQVADAWRTNGQTEHASVAAFAELSLELVALGAPPRLIEAAHQDALDEMRHTEQCFDLARSLDGRPRGPRDFAAASRVTPRVGPRALRLAHLAVTSLYDGALYEGLSARVVAGLAKEVAEPSVRAVLELIARDEARHAAHGFDVVRWCVQAGGAPVVRALEVAVERMGAGEPHALIPDMRAADGRWEPWGIPGRARELAAWAEVRARVVTRTERLIVEARASSAVVVS